MMKTPLLGTLLTGWTVALALLGSASAAEEVLEQTVPESLAVCVVGHPLEEIDFPALQKAGFRWARKGVDWQVVEKEKGTYDFTYPDQLVKLCEDNGMGLVMTLAFGNKLYEPNSHRMVVSTPEGREGYANYAAALAERYKDKRVIYEFWNEANGSFWKSKLKDKKAQAKEFAAMQNLAAKKMKEADPDCLIAGAALYHIGWDKTQQWLDICLEEGMAENCDAVAFHSYGTKEENDIVENNVAWYGDMQKLVAKHGLPKDYPFWQTEYGINVEFKYWDEKDRGKRELMQAQSVVRNYLVSLLLKWPISAHYEYKSRTKATKGDKGLLRKDGTEAPVYDAIRTVTKTLDGYTFDRRLDEFGADTYVLLFTKKGAPDKYALWTAPRGKEQKVTLPASATGDFRTVTMMGQAGTAKPSGGKLELTATNAPLYVEAPGSTK